ncbi:MAG TPA: UDP-N-acetylmuramoyl-L-alanyl-D-glutamate--2,6-diaminopimelate ligase [Solirubrobacteraceae bacterium]|jgi:UDP-N-acetylmuramoyl-L-alanyl-D-glutamate--2,6-diaminopimelate ligase|nr:UDP-N-acetylmuramoyl-L-alanyl-D-glutamate--2,6-diaminopimelate ligase [Solirubrobacteraceae bacterium]
MRLGELIPTDAADPSGAVEIAALAYDSRRVGPGTLFFCVPGFTSDGHDFAGQAVAAGAAALVVERPLGLGVPEALVPSARAAMGPAAARFYGDPTRSLRVVGVTGTNGKTTTAFLVRALLEASGERCGLLGTVGSVIGGRERPAARTTPEAIDLQGDFRAMLDGGERACAMEVSSHALALGRTEGVHFAGAIFTNLTQDHLDFHATMEEYFQSKRRLFVPGGAAPGTDAQGAGAQGPPGLSVLNLDDPYGRRLAAELSGAVSFAMDHEADYRARDVKVGFGGCDLRLRTPGGEHALSLPLPGRFNVSNALGALAAVHGMGGDLATLLGALERGVRVPGRFEPVQEGQDFAVLVDYAHTPDSLQNVLAAARELARGRVVCVFGAGGDRDRGKRPMMGRIAAGLADVTIVTSDNPRSEDPGAILAEILAGAGGTSEGVRAEVDRRAAIAQALELAREGDVVVIAGKGHEQGQELAEGRKVPFDDATVAREALRALAGSVARP